MLNTSKDRQARLSAISDLALIGSVNREAVIPAVPALLAVFKADKDNMVRSGIAFAIANTQSNPAEVVPLYLEALKDTKLDRSVVVALATGLQRYGKKAQDALPILMKLYKDELAKDASERDGAFLETVGGAIETIKRE